MHHITQKMIDAALRATNSRITEQDAQLLIEEVLRARDTDVPAREGLWAGLLAVTHATEEQLGDKVDVTQWIFQQISSYHDHRINELHNSITRRMEVVRRASGVIEGSELRAFEIALALLYGRSIELQHAPTPPASQGVGDATKLEMCIKLVKKLAEVTGFEKTLQPLVDELEKP